MKYVPMFIIRLRHPFYRQGLCPDFTVSATPESGRLLSNHRCVLKSNPYGVDVWMPSVQQQPFIPFSTGNKLNFELRLNNPDFAFYTGDTISFTDNQGVGVFQNGQDINDTPFTVASVRQPFLNLVIERDFNQLPSIPGTIEIKFAGKSFFWVYYIIADSGKAQDILITDTHLNVDWQKMPSPDDDSVYGELQKQYPSNDIVRFISPQSLLCEEISSQSLQLKVSGTGIAEKLPSPDFRNALFLKQANNNVSAIYSIVKYCSNPTT